MNIYSFIITITFKEKPVILRLTGGPGCVGDAYEVSPLNNVDFPTFYMQQSGNGWHITTDVPDDIRTLESKLSSMIEAYTEGQGIV